MLLELISSANTASISICSEMSEINRVNLSELGA